MHQPGDLLEKYKIISLLGKGGMGAVYAAENTVIGKQVALKVLRPDFAENESSVQRFLQEARTAASIDHPGIVEIFDFGWSSTREPYIVMELLKGLSLDALIEQHPQGLPIDFAINLAKQMLSVLVAVHEKGIIHRDLKPENIFLSQRGDGSQQVRILDFGISKMKTDEKTGRLTETGAVLGTPYFMSPEQAMGSKDIDQRADIWSAGAIIYEMLTGQAAFTGDSYNAVLIKIYSRQFTQPRSIRADIPSPIEEALLGAMTWDREQRFLTMTEFLNTLESARSVSRDKPPKTLFVPAQTNTDLEANGPSSDLDQAEVEVRPGRVIPTLAANARPSDAGPFGSPDNEQTTPGYNEVSDAQGPPGFGHQPLVTHPGEAMAPQVSLPRPPPQRLPETLSPAITARSQGRESSSFLKIASIVGLFTILVASVSTALIYKILTSDDQAPIQSREVQSNHENQPPVVVATSTPSKQKLTTNPRELEPAPVKSAPAPLRDELTSEEIEQTLDTHASKVTRCLGMTTSAPPVAQIKMQVRGDGRTTFQEVSPSQQDTVTTCLEEAFASIRFPATGRDPITVTHSFDGPRDMTPEPAGPRDMTPEPQKRQVRRPSKGRSTTKSGRFKANPFD